VLGLRRAAVDVLAQGLVDLPDDPALLVHDPLGVPVVLAVDDPGDLPPLAAVPVEVVAVERLTVRLALLPVPSLDPKALVQLDRVGDGHEEGPCQRPAARAWLPVLDPRGFLHAQSALAARHRVARFP